MSLNLYNSVRDPELNVSFTNPEWLSPYQVLDKLGVQNLLSYQINPYWLIYPNEVIVSDSSSKNIIDLILLAKYVDKHGGIRLESILLSQLINLICISSSNTSININMVQILSIEKDTYYWECVKNSNYIPQYAFRVGFDNLAKQFSYIGRMKASVINENLSMNMRNFTCKISNFFGSLINIYEYIPAIVLQLHDLDNQLDSLWSTIKLSIKTNSTSKDYNLIANNYEVLCLKKQPASLKQLCINKLVKFEEETNCLETKFELNEIEKFYFSINRSFKSLPNSIRNMLWPYFLVPGQCLGKKSKMRSSNGLYELSLNEFGNLKFCVNMYYSNKITYEKNVETLLVSNSGIYLIYENNRRPTLLYKHKPISCDDSHDLDDDFNKTMFDSLLGSSYVMELSNDGFLRVIIHKSRPNVINLINVNDFFRPIVRPKDQLIANISVSKETIDSSKENGQSLLINVKFIGNLKNLKDIPIKIISLVVRLLKSFFQNIRRTTENRHLN